MTVRVADPLEGSARGGFYLALAPDCKSKVLQEAIANVVDPTVNFQILPTSPRVQYDGGLAQIADLLQHVEFAKEVRPLIRSDLALQKRGVLLPDADDVLQPRVDQSKPLPEESRKHSTAPIVPAHDDVLHLEHIDSVLQNGETVEVGMDDEICHVSVDEEFTGPKPDYLVRRNSAVGAPDPKVLRRLLLGQVLEERGVAPERLLDPGSVVFEEMLQILHVCLACSNQFGV